LTWWNPIRKRDRKNRDKVRVIGGLVGCAPLKCRKKEEKKTKKKRENYTKNRRK